MSRCKYKYINMGNNKIVREHVLVMEAHLGRKLVKPELVHHKDGNKSNNHIDNLVLCTDDAHHMLLHRQDEAVRNGHPMSWIKCQYCGKFDDPEQITTVGIKGYHRYHKACKNAYLKSYKLKLKEATNVPL